MLVARIPDIIRDLVSELIFSGMWAIIQTSREDHVLTPLVVLVRETVIAWAPRYKVRPEALRLRRNGMRMAPAFLGLHLKRAGKSGPAAWKVD